MKMENFGERIRELKKERELTVYEMATRLGVSRNVLTTCALGEKEPYALGMFREMAKILQMPLKSLWAGENEIQLKNNLIVKNF